MVQLTSDAFAFGGDLMPVDEALAIVAANIPPVAEIEMVSLVDADGRVLATDVFAPVNLPVFDNSAVDGYAVAHADLSRDGATVMAVSARVPAGQAAARSVQSGTAVRIFTGAPMPAGTDTVFMQEDVTVNADGTVTLPPGLKPGANSRPKGEDIAQGSLAVAAGRRLEPRDIALLAALGVTSVAVRRRPKVAVFSTGDELRNPGDALGEAAIFDSNRFSLMAMLKRAGCEVTDLGILKDERSHTAAQLDAATTGHDLVVTSGGVSTGEEDHVRAAIGERGSMVFWRLGIKPGRPVAMGIMNGTPLVGLPGNPVAVFVTFAHVLRPLVMALAGGKPSPLPPMIVTSGFSYSKKAGRREYVRVSLEQRDGATIALKYPVDGAGVLTSLTRTDGLAELPESCTAVREGELIAFHPYSQLI
ncbi:molybdopterin molybdotransferase MoeA [Oryzibacter oryziterrae]|uniref:molybdopterin molybdotransferase MoeA n=1 Tax=Oryzibacter oryziterrae TaxID=2766474 RepID=UPI001F289F96|nr:gephyrin-like molybdotransferase Glp [Oryzibacter oryziterrae]